MTPVPGRALPAWVVEVPLAHRGLWDDERPENSLAAFVAARDAGVGVELDVHATADGVAVVVHDPDLRRVAGVPLLVADATLDQLREARLPDGSVVPTLAEVLEELGDTPVMVELKNLRLGTGVVEPAAAAALGPHLAAGGRAYVASFHPGSLGWFRRHAPQVLRAQTAQATYDRRVPPPIAAALSRTWLNGRSRPHLLSLELGSLTGPVARRWRGRGGVVATWTVRDAEGLAHAAGHADAVVFEGIAPPAWPPPAADRPHGPADGGS